MAGNLPSLLPCKFHNTDKRHFEVEAEISVFGGICCAQFHGARFPASHGNWCDEEKTFHSIIIREAFHRASTGC